MSMTATLDTDACRLIGAALAYYASHVRQLADRAERESLLNEAEVEHERRDAREAARLGYHFDVADEAEVR